MTAKRDALRTKLIEAAEKRMRENGLTGLRARDITKDAGCALGGLYNAFGDLDDLILHVNARTLDRLSTEIETARGTLAPDAALLSIALAYAKFARANRTLWDALFDHKLDENAETPDWFRTHQRGVMAHVVDALMELQPDLAEQTAHLRARTYFSAIHGIVAISLQGRFVGLPGADLEAEIERFVSDILVGSRNAARDTAP